MAKKNFNKIIWFFKKSRLAFGLLIALSVVVIMTLASAFLYVQSGVSKLDLSRPGYEGVIEEVDKNRRQSESFSSSGPINGDVLEEFLSKYQNEDQSLDSAGDFEDGTLSDQQLGLPEITNP